VQTPPRLKCQPKLIQDSNTDFKINPDLDPDVCRIADKMLWIHCLVVVSRFAKFRKLSAGDCIRNGKKSLNYAAMKTMESDLESTCGFGATPKVTLCPYLPRLVDVCSAVMCSLLSSSSRTLFHAGRTQQNNM